jgi:nitroreductase
VSTRWGRIGTDGKSNSNVKDSFNKIVDKRRRKGYYKINKEHFDQLTGVAKAIGTAHKVSHIQWVIVPDPDYVQIGAAYGAFLRQATPEMLADPENDPALLVDVRIRKKSGDLEVSLLFFGDKTYQLDGIIMEPTSEVLKKMPKIAAAIGESL